MHELIQEFCTGFYDWHPENKFFYARRISEQLASIDRKLTAVSSRFIDLDPSVKPQNEEEFRDFKDSLLIFQNEPPNLREHLEVLFEAFSLYLLMRDRYGEAAEWFLRNEYDENLKVILDECRRLLIKIDSSSP